MISFTFNMNGNKNYLKMKDDQTLLFLNNYGKEEVLWNTKL